MFTKWRNHWCRSMGRSTCSTVHSWKTTGKIFEIAKSNPKHGNLDCRTNLLNNVCSTHYRFTPASGLIQAYWLLIVSILLTLMSVSIRTIMTLNWWPRPTFKSKRCRICQYWRLSWFFLEECLVFDELIATVLAEKSVVSPDYCRSLWWTRLTCAVVIIIIA